MHYVLCKYNLQIVIEISASNVPSHEFHLMDSLGVVPGSV